MSVRLMLTGAGGQLGREIVHLSQECRGLEIFPFTRQQLDVTDGIAVFKTVKELKPHVILNTAAYTNVDLAESNEKAAFEVNAMGAKYLSAAAVDHGAKLCHISTDYVFDGNSQRPYREDDDTSPLGIYGKSKELGERFVREICPRSFIVRTSWLYGAYGRNFVSTMLHLGMNSGPNGIRVVHDQKGCPTWTRDVATFVFRLVCTETYGIYHASNTGSATWYEFAKKIFEVANLNVSVVPVRTEDFTRPAQRPKFSVLAPILLKQRGFEPLRPWEDALAAYFLRHGGGIPNESP